MPGIHSRFQQHNGDLVVLAVDSEEPLNLVQDFRDEFELTFDLLLDSDGAVNRLYQVRGLPTSVFINEHGMIQFVHIGFMTESQLDGYLAQMGLGEETALGSGSSAD
jgi:peroxiredoxin